MIGLVCGAVNAFGDICLEKEHADGDWRSVPTQQPLPNLLNLVRYFVCRIPLLFVCYAALIGKKRIERSQPRNHRRCSDDELNTNPSTTPCPPGARARRLAEVAHYFGVASFFFLLLVRTSGSPGGWRLLVVRSSECGSNPFFSTGNWRRRKPGHITRTPPRVPLGAPRRPPSGQRRACGWPLSSHAACWPGWPSRQVLAAAVLILGASPARFEIVDVIESWCF